MGTNIHPGPVPSTYIKMHEKNSLGLGVDNNIMMGETQIIIYRVDELSAMNPKNSGGSVAYFLK
jgi:hypothetical protein